MIIAGMDKTSFVDYPTKIATVLFTAGCNFNCWYCHNRHIIGKVETSLSEDEVFGFLQRRRGMVDAVVVSGGEPTCQTDLEEFLRKVKPLGFLVKLDTNGTNSEKLKDLVKKGLVDYVAMDYKAEESKYAAVTGAERLLDEVRKSRDFLLTGSVPYEFRTTVIPSFTEEDVKQMARELTGARAWYLQAYKRPDFLDESFPPSMEKVQMRKLYEAAREEFPSVRTRGVNLD